MNIEVGEYVRTKKGNIGKVLDTLEAKNESSLVIKRVDDREEER